MKRFLAILANLVICADQALSCCIRLGGEWGTPDETLSARLWRARDRYPRAQRLLDAVFFWERETLPGDIVARHCQIAYLNEMERAIDYQTRGMQ